MVFHDTAIFRDCTAAGRIQSELQQWLAERHDHAVVSINLDDCMDTCDKDVVSGTCFYTDIIPHPLLAEGRAIKLIYRWKFNQTQVSILRSFIDAASKYMSSINGPFKYIDVNADAIEIVTADLAVNGSNICHPVIDTYTDDYSVIPLVFTDAMLNSMQTHFTAALKSRTDHMSTWDYQIGYSAKYLSYQVFVLRDGKQFAIAPMRCGTPQYADVLGNSIVDRCKATKGKIFDFNQIDMIAYLGHTVQINQVDYKIVYVDNRKGMFTLKDPNDELYHVSFVSDEILNQV